MKRPDHLGAIGLVTPGTRPRLLIEVRGGVGFGPTTLAAFDDALNAVNVANFNLLQLSSVIPPQSKVEILDQPQTRRPEGTWGDRLYVVMAQRRSNIAGETVAAGIGWVQDPHTGEGLFVEHQADNAATVRTDIDLTLGAMIESRAQNFGPIQCRVISETTPADSAACALVLATFESQPWTGPRQPTSMLN